MKIDYEWTDGSNEDFHKFYLKTEEFYISIHFDLSQSYGILVTIYF